MGHHFVGRWNGGAVGWSVRGGSLPGAFPVSAFGRGHGVVLVELGFSIRDHLGLGHEEIGGRDWLRGRGGRGGSARGVRDYGHGLSAE